MTNEDILKIALQQSAYDFSCNVEDFMKDTNVVVLSQKNEKARKYLSLPLACDLVSYGNNIIAQVCPELKEVVSAYINRYQTAHCFETPNLHVLNQALAKHQLQVCFMAEYFLPDMTQLKELPCTYELKVLYQKDFTDLYTGTWSNALCEDRKELDVLGVGAYDNGRLIGLAACSADCEMMYQIGVDVLPEYRRQGVAAALTSRLALEIIRIGKVPFYCAAWSNIKSVRNAIKCGFRPAWVNITAKSNEFVEQMNQ